LYSSPARIGYKVSGPERRAKLFTFTTAIGSGVGVKVGVGEGVKVGVGDGVGERVKRGVRAIGVGANVGIGVGVGVHPQSNTDKKRAAINFFMQTLLSDFLFYPNSETLRNG